MFGKSKKTIAVDPEQHELMETAQKRIGQKKRLYTHFVFFLVGSVLLIFTNKVLKYGDQYEWAEWAIAVWGILLVMHLVNVFVLQRFLGKDWERSQREKLVQAQKRRIAKLQKEVEVENPLPQVGPKTENP